MKTKSSKTAATMAVGLAAGAVLGALGTMQMSGISNSKLMKNAKKSIKKNASRAAYTIESLIDSVPKMLS